MLIGIEDSWLIEIAIDYLTGDEFQQMSIQEETGLALPVLAIKFSSERNEKIRQLLKERYIKIGFGKHDIETYAEYEIFDFDLQSGSRGEYKQDVVLYAFCGRIEYLTLPFFRAYNSESDPLLSNEVWDRVMSRNSLKPISIGMNDQMNWLQCAASDRQFLQHVTTRGYYADDDPMLTAITKEARAYYLPFSNLKKFPEVFGNTEAVDREIGTYNEVNRQGILSAIWGKQRRTLFHHFEEGTDDLVEAIPTTQIVSPGLKEASLRYAETTYLNDNVHPQYIRALEQNQQHKASLSADAIGIQLNEYTGIELLNLLEFLYERTEDGLQEKVSGDWLVVRSDLQITAQTFQQYLELSRERIL